MPDLIDEVTPEPEPEPIPGPDGGTKFAGSRPAVDQTLGPRRIPPRQPPEKRRFDVAVRNTAGALVVGLLAFGGSNLTDNPAIVIGLWVLAVAALLVALFQANRARVHITTHPERLRGLWLTAGMAVLSVVGLLAIGIGTLVALGDGPASDAPADLGDLQSVQVARWTNLRIRRIADNDWKTPAKDAGTCWGADTKHTREVPDRVESETHEVSCDDGHTEEVPIVFAVNRDADAAYPGVDGLLVAARTKCAPLVRRIGQTKAGKGVAIRLSAEYPTEKGWEAGDHDVACVLITASRKGQLAP
ncbi:MAG: septum formation family protein [Acidimicrobiales bacterium]